MSLQIEMLSGRSNPKVSTALVFGYWFACSAFWVPGTQEWQPSREVLKFTFRKQIAGVDDWKVNQDWTYILKGWLLKIIFIFKIKVTYTCIQNSTEDVQCVGKSFNCSTRKKWYLCWNKLMDKDIFSGGTSKINAWKMHWWPDSPCNESCFLYV